jgi:hypothetical protein
MGSIYQHAVLTIVAAVAKSAIEGFLHIVPQPSYLVEPFEIPYHDGNTGGNDKSMYTK